MTKHLDRAKLLDLLDPDVILSKYKGRLLPENEKALLEIRKAIRAEEGLDIEPAGEPIGNTEQYPRAEMTTHLLQPAPNLEGIRKALEAATPGPWQAVEHEYDVQVTADHIAFSVCDMDDGSYGVQTLNAHLIANAPTWLFALLAEVERLQSALDTRQDSIDVLTSQLTDEVAMHAKTVVKAERLQRQISDHGPEGRNYTNAEYVALQTEAEKWRVEAFRKYPTPDAYEAACAALEKHRQRADEAEKANAALLEGLQWYAKEENWQLDDPFEERLPEAREDAGQRARNLLSLYGGKGDTDAALE